MLLTFRRSRLLERRKRLGKGELSSIALAMKTNQAFMTDDQKARKLGKEVIGNDKVQTTPHLLGWLFFEGKLLDVDKEDIVAEHKQLGEFSSSTMRKFIEKLFVAV